MKYFLKKTFLFLSIVFLIGFAALWIYTLAIQNSIPSIIEDRITELYIGDSHMQCSIDDRMIPTGKNLSQSAESYFFTYQKLKYVLSTHTNITNIYLGYGYHSLSNSYDAFISGEKSASVSPKYFFISPLKDKLQMIVWNKNNFTSYMKGIIKAGADNLSLTSDNNFYGSYRNRFIDTKASESSIDKRIDFQFYTDGEMNDFSQINLESLNKIIALCKEKGIILTMVNTPVHPYYKNQVPDMYIKKYNEIVTNNNLKLMDISGLSLSDVDYIPDGDHVSEKGSKITTQKFISLKGNS